MKYRKLLVEHFDTVEKIVRVVARRQGLSYSDAEEFASVVRLKLVDRNYAILRKFEGRSSLVTYLTVVINRLCFDFCRTKWGKWRPSASAKKLGAVATLLEQLVAREGITFDEAVGTLQTNHGVSETREELHDIFLQLPSRDSRRDASEAWDPARVERVPGPHPDDQHVVDRVEGALSRAIATLSEEDKDILILRFDAGLPVAQVARSLRLEPRPLYRRLNRLFERLRAEMKRQGVDQADIARVISHPDLSMGSVLIDASRRQRQAVRRP